MTVDGRRRATASITTTSEQIPADLIATRSSASRAGRLGRLIAYARRQRWNIDAERISCPVRIICGTDDLLLAWPSSAVRSRHDWLPNADWVALTASATAPNLMFRSRRHS